ncbi:TonB-dependent receptor [Bacteroides sp. 224]|uniref:TonB-dependent receptor n=1 Tax=Bacteroides sp. 224 TaxID=2302936 RepID=UPI0013D2A1B3|nr:TonB-dependent receptor [Bacteroides sp. 224]NDV65122.1 TonB-dependent receptor [Bacteroides sp. 224]
MKKYIFLLVSICSVLTSYANDPEMPVLSKSDANVIGHVIDKKTGEHLSYITIILKGTTIGTVTDATGHYFLKNLPEGKFTIEASSVGYKSVSKEIILVKGKTLEIDFEIEEDAVALDGVVVSANRSETTRRLAPTLVNVMDLKMFEVTNSTTLSQGLNFQPGVRVETNCQNCGFQQVRINGLDGPYTQILMDSRPIFSALSGVYGLEQIPASMIERVEVMRGGGSALFGSSAIAGTINIITKEPIRNSGQISHTLSSIGGSNSFDNNTSLNASLVTEDHKAGLYIFGQNRHRSGYDHDDDGYSELPKLKNQTVGFRSYLKTSTYSKLTVEYHHMQEFRRGGDLLSRPPHEANIAEQLEHSIDGGGLKFDVFSPDEKHRLGVYTSAQSTDRNSYYGANQNPNAYGDTKDFTFIGGVQHVYNSGHFLFMPSSLISGLEFSHNNLKDNIYQRCTKQIVNIGSAFIQNEWKNDKWGILVGGRFDKHNMISHLIFSPRANVRFNPTENINLRVSYSSGFRAPQAFDEDLHVGNVQGTVSMIELASDLKEERSQSFSASADIYQCLGAYQANFLIEGFYTRLTDVFVLDEIGTNDEAVLVKRRSNGSGAKVAGVTLEGKVAYRSLWQIQTGLTMQKSRYDKAERWSEDAPAEKKIFRTPDVYGYFTASYSPVKPLSIALSGTYTGSMLTEHWKGAENNPNDTQAVKTPDFWDMGIKLSYDFKIYKSTVLQVNAGVQNMLNAYQDDFDKGKNRDSGYIYGPSLPRTYYAGVKISY